jgi:hypothetical protein
VQKAPKISGEKKQKVLFFEKSQKTREKKNNRKEREKWYYRSTNKEILKTLSLLVLLLNGFWSLFSKVRLLPSFLFWPEVARASGDGFVVLRETPEVAVVRRQSLGSSARASASDRSRRRRGGLPGLCLGRRDECRRRLGDRIGGGLGLFRGRNRRRICFFFARAGCEIEIESGSGTFRVCGLCRRLCGLGRSRRRNAVDVCRPGRLDHHHRRRIYLLLCRDRRP